MRRVYHVIVFFLIPFIICGTLNAQTYNGAGGSISSTDTSHFNISVSGLSSSAIDYTYGLEAVKININHTQDRDIDCFLVAPDGTFIELTTDNGGTGDNYTNTVFRNDIISSVTTGSAPFTGTYKPEGNLYSVNNGHNGNGTWQLRIIDDANNGVSGSLVSWSLTFGNNPAYQFVFSSSQLPIVVINTQGQIILDDPKIICNMGIIYNGTGIRNYLTDSYNEYNGKISIEKRGSSSQQFPKKSYGFETRDTTGNGKNDVSLLGMPKEHDWILSANYSDKSLCRNVLAYRLANEIGHYAVRTRYVDVVLNGQYIGVYILMENIKRDKNRVDISKLHPQENIWPDISGGYIIKIDKTTGTGGQGWTSSYPPINHPNGQTIYYQYEYPDPDSLSDQQKNYIEAYVDSFENALFGSNYRDSALGYAKFIGNNSFIDYFFSNELSKNVDGYRISTYLHKDKGKTLKAGPVWDYDIAFGNANYCNGNDTTGWAYQFPCTGDGFQIPAWWPRLISDTTFANQMKCRWINLRNTVINTSHINFIIDSIVDVINESKDWNFTAWPILRVYVWPNPSPYPTTYTGEIQNLKNWMSKRISWLDSNMPGHCDCSLSITSQNTTCNSSCDGQATALALSSYQKTYEWDNGTTSSSITDLCEGTYNLSFADAIGCTRTASITISSPPTLTISTSKVSPSCIGVCSGSATANPSGGMPPYKYSWSTGETTAAISNLCPGTYIVTIHDANSCIVTSSVNIQAPSKNIQVTITGTNISCNASCNGTAIANVTSGISPYTYHWQHNGTTTFSVDSLCAGNYTVIVTDSNGCRDTESVSITQPNPFSLNVSAMAVSCFGESSGSTTVTAVGGTAPYSYSWSPVGGNNSTASNLGYGSYTVTVTDIKGCSKTMAADIVQPSDLLLSTSAINVTCNNDKNGSASVIVSGGTSPYTYAWYPSGETTVDANNLSAGLYTVTVTDVHGCTKSSNILVSQPSDLTLSTTHVDATCSWCSDGTASSTASGGIPPYTYLWSPSLQTTSTIKNISAGNHTICVTDSNSCTVCNVVEIMDDPSGISRPNHTSVLYVYPNPIREKTNFVFALTSHQHVTIRIVDVTGNLICEVLNDELFAGEHITTFNAYNLANGIYTYEFKSSDKIQVGKLIINH